MRCWQSIGFHSPFCLTSDRGNDRVVEPLERGLSSARTARLVQRVIRVALELVAARRASRRRCRNGAHSGRPTCSTSRHRRPSGPGGPSYGISFADLVGGAAHGCDGATAAPEYFEKSRRVFERPTTTPMSLLMVRPSLVVTGRRSPYRARRRSDDGVAEGRRGGDAADSFLQGYVDVDLRRRPPPYGSRGRPQAQHPTDPRLACLRHCPRHSSRVDGSYPAEPPSGLPLAS